MLAKRSLAVLKRGIDDKLFSGAGYALVSKRLSGGIGTLGRLAFDPETDRVNRNTLFDAASLTKPLATATATLQLVAEGRMSLDDTAAGLLHQSAETCLPGVMLHHLLTHTSGLPPVPVSAAGGGDLAASALATPVVAAPGSQYVYSDTGYILLAEIVRRTASLTVAQWFADRIKPELHLEDSGFRPDLSLPIAVTSDDESLDGLPHDPLARAAGGIAGHAGLFLSIDDLAAFLRALLGSGRALLPETLFPRLFVNEIGEIGGQSLGFFTRGNAYLPDVPGFSPDAVGHSGFTGCFLLIDRGHEAGVGLLTNAVLSDAENANDAFLVFRREWLTAASADLGLATPGTAS